MTKTRRIVNDSLKYILPLVLAIIGYFISRALKERDIQVKYIEIAAEILSQKPESDDQNIREWAVDVINMYSDVKLNDSLADELEKGSITLPKVNGSTIVQEQNELINKSLLGEELMLKKLNSMICNAKNYLDGGSLDAPLKACQLYREVLDSLSISSKSSLIQSLLFEANSDYNNGHYTESAIKYKVLFKDYYENCNSLP